MALPRVSGYHRDTMIKDPQEAALRLLSWYDRHRRDLPWRARPGEVADPYRVWLSEIMLQQTTVPAVAPYFRAFTERWPTVADLAASPLNDLLVAWAGLGYYARARNLHKCATEVVKQFAGQFPDDEDALLSLPGIGAYTAAAITSIAFGKRAVVMDGNVERVISRIFAVEEPLPAVKPRLKGLAGFMTPDERPGDYAQAMMDLGATICTPRKPKCILCPWSDLCQARRAGIAEELPRKIRKADKPTRRGAAFWLINGDGDVLLRQRPPKGLLGGMTELPSTDWTVDGPSSDAVLDAAPLAGPVLVNGWRVLPGVVRHTFTHFHLELVVHVGRVDDGWHDARGHWVPLDRLGGEALPSVMVKLVRHALAHA